MKLSRATIRIQCMKLACCLIGVLDPDKILTNSYLSKMSKIALSVALITSLKHQIYFMRSLPLHSSLVFYRFLETRLIRW